MAGEIGVMDEALDLLSRPANVVYNWLVMISEHLWKFNISRTTYEDVLKDAQFFKMLLAVHFGLQSVLVKLLKTHTRPAENALDPVIGRLACHAAQYGYKEIVGLLLTQKDVDWNVCGITGKSLLELVDEDTLRTLLQKQNFPVNAIDPRGESALHEAVMNARTSRVRILLEAGADVEAPNKYGVPVIIKSVFVPGFDESWKEMMDLLLEYKVDINAHAHDEHGNTALHWAARLPLFSSYAVEYLVSKGANPNLPNVRGQTPLDLAEVAAAETCKTDSSKRNVDNKNLKIATEIIQVLREADGKTAREMRQPSVGEQGPCFPPEWLDRLKHLQETQVPRDEAAVWYESE